MSASGCGRSPTLRQILQHEVGEGMHRLPYLTDNSGASGLLWIIRQLQYQTTMFENIIQIPIAFPNSKAAAKAAYKSTYEAYHGFFVRQIFLSSCDATPDVEEILRVVSVHNSRNGDVDGEEETQLEGMVYSDDESDDFSWYEASADEVEQPPMNISSTPDESTEPQVQKPNVVEEVWGHFIGEWTKIHGFISQCVGNQVQIHPSRNAMRLCKPSDMLLNKQYSSSDVSMAANDAIPSYLEVMSPLLTSIQRRINELNMNDPSKV